MNVPLVTLTATRSMRPEGMTYRPDIDGLRALAVMLVIAFHFYPRQFAGGFTGVDVFFVVSGFLITSLIRHDLARGTFSLLDFFARRFRRLLPALLLVIVATLAAAGFLLFPQHFAQIGIESLAGATFTANLLYWSQAGYFDPSAHSKPLLHLWSLGVEEQFYLIWAPLMVLLTRFRPLMMILLVAACSFALSILIVTKHPATAFFLLPTRLWELLLGAALTYAASAPPRLATPAAGTGIALILVAAAIIGPATPHPGWHALLPTIGAALFIWGGAQALPNRIFSTQWIVLIGLISYPLYLWHWPLLTLSDMMRGSTSPPLLRGALIAIAFGLAWLTYQYVERPIRSWTQTRLRLRGAAATLCGTALLLAGAGYVIAANDGLAGRFPPHVRALLLTPFDEQSIQRQYRADICFVHRPEDVPQIAEACVPQRPDVLIIGDSSALSLYPGFAALADERKLSIAQLTSPACPPLVSASSPELDNCVAIQKAFFQTITRLQPHHILVSGSSTSNLEYVRQLPETLARLKQISDAELHLLGPLPWWRIALQNALFRLYLRDGRVPDRTDFSIDARYAAADGQMRKIARDAGIRYASPRSAMCNADGCLAVTSDGALTSWRGSYLTPEASRFMVKMLFSDLVPKAP